MRQTLRYRMNEISFTKMHGLGNDYIYIHCPANEPHSLSELSIEMSQRHTGVGGDGIILIEPSDVADFRMRIFNADGSEAKMCGNGSRCVGKYVYDHNLTAKRTLTLETLAGIRTLELHVDGASGKVESVTVDMGAPVFEPEEVPVRAASKVVNAPVPTSMGELHMTAVSMGNPHGVIFLPTLAGLPINDIGPELECHEMWPDRANIEFAAIAGPDVIEMQVWERGSGVTMACGTGACATAVAAVLNGLTGKEVTVKLPGGDLKVEWREDGHVYMTGPATEVFNGIYKRRNDSTYTR